MLRLYIPGRPAHPHNCTHLIDSTVLNSNSASSAAPLGSCEIHLRRKTRHQRSYCSKGLRSLGKNGHHLAAAGHIEWPESDSRNSRCTTLLTSASSKGLPKSPKRQFASDLGVEEQQKGYAESFLDKLYQLLRMQMLLWWFVSIHEGGIIK